MPQDNDHVPLEGFNVRPTINISVTMGGGVEPKVGEFRALYQATESDIKNPLPGFTMVDHE